ncbi:MAG: VCBS repeat-containing protein [Pyrinomonadaceae bacterium]|nr:VCBS repeat-containing protein [Pyrinomonadaceae bacterium]
MNKADAAAAPELAFPTYPRPTAIASGDFNLDNKPDLAILTGGGETDGTDVSIFLNNGAGLFTFHVSYGSGNLRSLHDVKVADFNMDGKPDLVTQRYGFQTIIPIPATLQVRLGDGAGNFAPPLERNTIIGPMVIGDYNGDTKQDIAVPFTHSQNGFCSQASGAVVYLSNGNGAFTEMPAVTIRWRANAGVSGDFNNDGKLDLATASQGDFSCAPPNGPILTILFGDGLGNFPTRNELPAFWGQDVVAGDFNIDGKLDLALTPSTTGVQALFGTGAGDFVAGPSTTVSGGRENPQAADFNADGKLDIALVDRAAHAVKIIYGNGTGSFPSFRAFNTGSTPNFQVVKDFNNDANLDLAITNNGSSNVTVILDTNTTAPLARTQYDFDGDFRADIAVYRDGNTPNAPSYWHILRSNNNTYLGVQHGANGDKPIPADYNNDRKAEVAVWRPSTGTWFTSTNAAINYGAFQWGTNGDIPIPGDFDADGKADYAVYRPSNGIWYVLRSSDGAFQFQQFGTSTDKPLLGDFDGDSKTDFAFYRPGATALANSFWNVIQSSNGAFLSAQFGRGEDKPVPADYDGDGKTNFAVYRASTFTWFTSLNPSINYGATVWGAEGDVPAPADYDRDGKADLAIFRPGSGIWYILQSSNGGVVGRQWGSPGDKPVPSSFIP